MPGGGAWTYTVLLASLGIGAVATAFSLPRLRVLISRRRLLRDGRSGERQNGREHRHRRQDNDHLPPCSERFPDRCKLFHSISPVTGFCLPDSMLR